MDSMKRSEASSSHHQNKVVLTNQVTDSNNKQVNLSGSNLNNNTISNKQHQSAPLNPNQTPGVSSSSASAASDIAKDSNFEYDDNEWDVGIGDLIIDLDADIEKSSVSNQHPSTSTQALATISSLSNESESLNTQESPKKIEPVKALTKGGITSSTTPKHHSSSTSSPSLSSSVAPLTPGHHHHHHHHHKSSNNPESGNRSESNLSKHSVLLSQLNNKHSSTFSEITGTLKRHYSSSSGSSTHLESPKSSKGCSLSTMSSTTNSSGGKSATKLSVDHQATLDKGLKMKIKRTKPGTKTSEAKHEIVKAEQNGTSSLSSSNAEETNSNSSSSSNNKKHSQTQPQPQPPVASSMSQQQQQQQQQQQGTKRGSSGHRRDKTKEKTTHHNQRDKNEHNSTSSGGGVGSNSSSGDRSCSCTHDMHVNGIQQPCSSANCIRTRTSDQSMTSLSQRLSNQNNTSTSTSTSLFSSNTNTGPSLSSSSNTPNAPGPPSSKDGAKQSNQQHTASSGSGNSSSGSGSTNSGGNSTVIGSGSSASSSNVLKSQLQSTSVPSSLLNALSSGTSVVGNLLSTSSGGAASSSGSNTLTGEHSSSSLQDEKGSSSPPPAKRHKCDPKDMVDVCVGTSVGTITEPDCLGPCEPGTSVTLEGIVWHETEGGVLVVNVTWRGKTYVGTLIDCTKHDWAPPRFCDSPTEEFDSRTPKGRGKRGRSSALFPVNDLSNFTETRSSMHSKLRNGGAKGRGGRGTTTTAESSSSKTTTTSTTTTASSSSGTSTSISSNTPSTSPVAFLPPRSEKRKSKDEPPSPVNGGGSGNSSNSSSSSNTVNSGSTISSVMNSSSGNNEKVNNGTSGTQSVVNRMTGLNVQISTKKCKSTSSPCAISPVLLECPEQDCSKKYKHANGLRYHQSHAHGSISSMDEDSSQPPESPQRVAPPTTPSPSPTVQLSNLPTVPVTTAAATLPASSATPTSTTASFSATTQVFTSVTLASNVNQNTTTTPTTTSSTVPSSLVSSTPSLLMTECVPTVSTPATVSHTSQASTASIVTTTSTQHTTTSPATAGGSITTGVAGSTQPTQPHPGLGSTSTLLGSALAGSQNASGAPCSQVPTTPQQQVGASPPTTNNGITTTPTRSDPNTKSKSGVLRFGPLPGDSPVSQGSSGVSSAPGSIPGGVTVAGNLLTMPPSTPGTPEGLNIKSQNCSKQKKNRKSPGPTDFDVAAASRSEDVQSPAYSDISDDSTPVVDPNDLDKSKGPQIQDIAKKPNETAVGQLGPLSGYGMYPYYPGMPHQSPYYSADHAGKPPGLGHSPLGPNASVDYKSKEPPLDLMNKPNQLPHQPPQSQPSQQGPSSHPQQLPPPSGEVPGQPNKEGAPGPPPGHPGASKMMQHFYPYGYMPAGFGYNLDPNYGPVSMISEESKLAQQQQQQPPPTQIKEERMKESPSPNEYTKMGPQMVPTKLIKSEPIVVKDIKTEGGHSMHPKDQPTPGPGQPSISAYGGGMFQRHGLNVGPPNQPPQHMNRDEELRRLFNYADQRRTGPSSGPSAPNMSTKDEPQSPSQVPPGHPNHGSGQHGQPSSQTSTNTPQQQSQGKGSKNSSSSQQLIKQQKDIKQEDKEMIKVKQEGQKPTMETQGPPPPPTSQYYPHSLYMSAAPFGFDPNHQMYRNMLVPTASYSAPPYHLQIPRYTTPEDLSRNPSTKALDLLQHHASQYYNSHKIHELREGAQGPTSNVKVSVSSPNLSQQSSQNPNMCIPPSNSSISSSGLSLQQQQQQQQQQASPSTHPQQQPPGAPLQPSQGGGPSAGSNPGAGVGSDLQKDPGGPGALGQKDARDSPPPQRHVHTHHHTHVGLGYPMFQAPYGAAVLASQQAAAAVTVISPFQTGPPAK